jgi:hypothetical protein
MQPAMTGLRTHDVVGFVHSLRVLERAPRRLRGTVRPLMTAVHQQRSRARGATRRRLSFRLSQYGESPETVPTLDVRSGEVGLAAPLPTWPGLTSGQRADRTGR